MARRKTCRGRRHDKSMSDKSLGKQCGYTQDQCDVPGVFDTITKYIGQIQRLSPASGRAVGFG